MFQSKGTLRSVWTICLLLRLIWSGASEPSSLTWLSWQSPWLVVLLFGLEGVVILQHM